MQQACQQKDARIYLPRGVTRENGAGFPRVSHERRDERPRSCMNQYAPGPLAPPAVAGAQTGTEPALPHNPTTPLATGAINQSDDTIEIVLVQPADNPNRS